MPDTFGDLHGHDAYDVLGVPPDASPATIQRTWRRLAKAHHPDQVTDARAKTEAEERLRLLNVARDVLLTRRAAYDTHRAAHRAAPVVDEEPEELIEDPWDTAAPTSPPDPWGAPTPDAPASADPWDTATPGRTAPHHVPPPRPAPAPPPHRAPPYSRRPQPMPPHFQPPHPVPPPWAHRRRSVLSGRARLGIGCALSVAVFWGALIILILVIALLHRESEPKPKVPVPSGYAGTWSGQIKDVDPKGSSWRVKLTLRAGLYNGEVHYVDGKCRGKAVPLAIDTSRRLTLRTVFPDDQRGCDVGDIHLAHRDDGRINAFYYKPDQRTKRAKGTLDHK